MILGEIKNVVLYIHCTSSIRIVHTRVEISTSNDGGLEYIEQIHFFHSQLDQQLQLMGESVFRPGLGPTQPPVQWIPGVLSPGQSAAGA
jgi:hypothetical protein